MKHGIIKIVALLLLISFISSCFHPVKTHRRYHGHGKYRGAGRFW